MLNEFYKYENVDIYIYIPIYTYNIKINKSIFYIFLNSYNMLK